MRVSILLTACTLGSACAPHAPEPSDAQEPLRVEVRLAQEDRAWIEGLIARRTALESPRDTPAPHRPAARPARAHIEEGPILSASYDSGTPLYAGEQVQTVEGWQRTGPWSAWHANGQIWEEGAYREGEEDGPWKWWYENGQPQASGSFVDGAHVGAWVFHHENGQVMAEGAFEEDRPIGRWVTFDEAGMTQSEGEFAAGKRTGRWIFYGPDGAVDPLHSGLYSEGERIGD